MWVNPETERLFKGLVTACDRFRVECGRPKHHKQLVEIAFILENFSNEISSAKPRESLEIVLASLGGGIRVQLAEIISKKLGGENNEAFGRNTVDIMEKTTKLILSMQSDVRQYVKAEAEAEAKDGRVIVLPRSSALMRSMDDEDLVMDLAAGGTKVFEEQEPLLKAEEDPRYTIPVMIDLLKTPPVNHERESTYSLFKSTVFHYRKSMAAAGVSLVSGATAATWSMLNKYAGDQMDKSLHTDATGVDAEMYFGGACLLFAMAACGVALYKTHSARPQLQELEDDVEARLVLRK